MDEREARRRGLTIVDSSTNHPRQDFTPEVLWQWWWGLTESQRRLICAAMGKPTEAAKKQRDHADAVSNAMVYANTMTKAMKKPKGK